MATFTQFISADLGNKEAAHFIRIEMVTKVVDTALRGNQTELAQGIAFALGQKGKLAKAYAAGFTAMGSIKRHAFEGKVTAQVAAVIAEKAKAYADVFSAAFVEVAPLATPELSEAEKAKAKVDKEAKAQKAFEEKAANDGYVKLADLKDADALAVALGLLTRMTAAELETIALDASSRLDTIKAKADKATKATKATKAKETTEA